MKKPFKIILGILILVLFCCINIICIKFYTDYKIKLTTVFVASHNIEGRHLITKEDIKEIQIPFAYIEDKAFINESDIVGKYTDIQGKIPVGSLFYKSMIFNPEDLPDNPITSLKENQIYFTLPTDVLALSGNTIVEGHRVDLYGSIYVKQDQYIQDILLSNVRVISIKDSKGYSLNHPSSNKTPYLISFAISQDSLNYLSMLNKIGKIDIYPNSKSYSTETEAKLELNSKIKKYLDEYETTN